MKKRLFWFYFFVFFVIAVWVIYLFSIQILDAYEFERIIQRRHNFAKQVITPHRGDVKDAKERVLITSEDIYQIDIDKATIKKRYGKNYLNYLKKAIKILSEEININKRTISQKLYSQNNIVYISDNITVLELDNIKNRFQENKIPGLVATFSKTKRIYSQEKLAPRLLGMIKKCNDEGLYQTNEQILKMEGKCGIEATFDEHLTGKYGWREIFTDGSNKNVPVSYLKKRKAVDGSTVYLTIDSEIQEIVKNALQEGIEKYEAKKAISVVMKPYTGEIVAMVGLTENDAHYSAGRLRSLSNLAVSFTFEPGSTLKPVTALLALEQDVYKKNEKINCHKYHIGERVITDAHEYDYLTLKDIIVHSSNPGISRVVEKIGRKSLYERMITLGLGRPTGSNIYGEVGGILRELKKWQGYSLHSMSFGQELSVTALQLANLYCSLANGGKVMRPKICAKIVDANNKIIKKMKPEIMREFSDKNSLNELKQFLKGVVDYGTATATKLDYIDIAGKTGTSEKAGVNTHGYAEDKYTSVFTGFFPVEKPEYVVVVIYDEPTIENYYYYSAQSAVPTFKKVAVKILNMSDNNIVSEVKQEKINYVKMPDLIGLNRYEAVQVLKDKALTYQIIYSGSGNVVTRQYPGPNTIFDSKKQVIISFKPPEEQKSKFNELVMPDLKGKTLRKALQHLKAHNLKVIIEGKSLVVAQSIESGSKVQPGETCKIIAN